jgi:hypothetical protein
MTEEERASERDRREDAIRHRGDVEAGSGSLVEPRRVPQMVSLRLDPELVRSLRKVASDRGLSLSDILREGAEMVVSSASRVRVYWHTWTIAEAPTSLATTIRMGTPESSVALLGEAGNNEPAAAAS